MICVSTFENFLEEIERTRRKKRKNCLCFCYYALRGRWWHRWVGAFETNRAKTELLQDHDIGHIDASCSRKCLKINTPFPPFGKCNRNFYFSFSKLCWVHNTPLSDGLSLAMFGVYRWLCLVSIAAWYEFILVKNKNNPFWSDFGIHINPIPKIYSDGLGFEHGFMGSTLEPILFSSLSFKILCNRVRFPTLG